VVPPAYLHDAHHWLILQGRYVCTARSPKCSACAISAHCAAFAAAAGRLQSAPTP